MTALALHEREQSEDKRVSLHVSNDRSHDDKHGWGFTSQHLTRQQNILEDPLKLLLSGYTPEMMRISRKTNKSEFIITHEVIP